MDTKSTTFVKPDLDDTKSWQKCNRIRSLFPTIKEDNSQQIKRKPSRYSLDKTIKNTNPNSINKIVPSNHSTSTDNSSSSSSTNSYNISSISKPYCRVRHPKAIPDYAQLRKYLTKFQNKFKQRNEILKSQLIPWLQKNKFEVYISSSGIENDFFWGLKSAQKEEKELQLGRRNLLKWWRLLLSSMLSINNDERLLYHEGIIEIISRPEFTDFDYMGQVDCDEWFQYKTHDQTDIVDEYKHLVVTTVKYAMDRLNQKAVYAHLVSFCAKVLAICYFKMPGLSFSLLKVLTIRPAIMQTLNREMQASNLPNKDHIKKGLKSLFPQFLHKLMVSDRMSYLKVLSEDSSESNSKFPLSLNSNWLRRWKSDDSELFFSFYKYYHQYLKVYLMSSYQNLSQYNSQYNTAKLTFSPGYMYLATFFSGKITSLIQREIISVTNGAEANLEKQTSFYSLSINNETNDENLQFVNETNPFVAVVPSEDSNEAKAHRSIFQLGKPKPLEIATRRYAECIVLCSAAPENSDLYFSLLNVWLRSVIKKTCLTEAEQVYSLIDLIEQVILELHKFSYKHHLIDIPFILHTLHIILSKSDHSITLLRALSFIYIHFSFLTSHVQHLDYLCNHIMLDLSIFERLLLHWGKNVRVFFLRCLMWRIGRVWQLAGVRWNSEADQMMKMMVRGNTDFTTCDGHSCRIKWSEYRLSIDDLSDIQVYRQCSLKIHIVLETLLASFHRNYSEIRNNLDHLEANEKSKLVSTNIKSSYTIVPKDHSYIPQLIPFNNNVSFATMNNNLKFKVQNNDTSLTKRSCPSPIVEKRQIVSRPKTTKGKFSKIFSLEGGNQIKNLVLNNLTSKEAAIRSMIMGNEEKPEGSKPSIDSTVLSLSLSSKIDLISNQGSNSCLFRPQNESNSLKTGVNQMLGKRNLHEHDSTSDMDISDDESPSSSKMCVLNSKMPMLSNLFHESIPSIDSQMSNDSISNDFDFARQWKYHPSNHIYATKVLSEIKAIVHEYCVWLGKVKEAKDNSSMIFVPGLSLEWPKNWSFSSL